VLNAEDYSLLEEVVCYHNGKRERERLKFGFASDFYRAESLKVTCPFRMKK
jgi:hypothetical protein